MSQLRNALVLALALTTTGLAVYTTHLVSSLAASAGRIEQHLRLQGFHSQIQQANAMLTNKYLGVLSDTQRAPCPPAFDPDVCPMGTTPTGAKVFCIHDPNR